MKLVLMRLGVATSSMTSLATKVLVIAGAIQAQATIRRESRLRIREARVCGGFFGNFCADLKLPRVHVPSRRLPRCLIHSLLRATHIFHRLHAELHLTALHGSALRNLAMHLYPVYTAPR